MERCRGADAGARLGLVLVLRSYSWERHERLVAELSGPGQLGTHIYRRDARGPAARLVDLRGWTFQIWATARQHPGESMAEWCAEGLGASSTIRTTRWRASCGASHGAARPEHEPGRGRRRLFEVNAAGANLNREWASGVYEGTRAYVRGPRGVLHARGDGPVGDGCHVDIHGDEAIAANFLPGRKAFPSGGRTSRASSRPFRRFLTALAGLPGRAGLRRRAAGRGNMAVGSARRRAARPERHLEMPFKDTLTPAEAADPGGAGRRAARALARRSAPLTRRGARRSSGGDSQPRWGGPKAFTCGRRRAVCYFTEGSIGPRCLKPPLALLWRARVYANIHGFLGVSMRFLAISCGSPKYTSD